MRHSLESPFHCGSNDTPLVVVESVRQNIRGLECVRLGDLIIDVVLCWSRMEGFACVE
jgi:hypothetical protein